MSEFGVMREAQFLQGTTVWSLEWMRDFLEHAGKASDDIRTQANRMVDTLQTTDQSAATGTTNAAAGAGRGSQPAQPSAQAISQPADTTQASQSTW